jgi:hypothetical protein
MSSQFQEPAGVVGAYDQMMRGQVGPQLRAAGFTGTLRSFTVRHGKARGELRWVKDGRAVRAGLLRFTAYIDYWCGGGRIAELLPAPALDTWWDLHSGEPAGPVADGVVIAAVRYALPAILAGLEEPDRVTDPLMYEAQAHGAGWEPDGGGADPAAAYVRPRGSEYDEVFAGFASSRPDDRLDAAYGTTMAPADPRTVPALLHHLEHDPAPVVRKLIASRVLPSHGFDPRVAAGLRRTAELDAHPGVRWAGRYALRILQPQTGDEPRLLLPLTTKSAPAKHAPRR